ncbi:uncharacterized protein EAE97_006507 [Botrytis byssoidea]|uniref:Uncharacterized protein n=1 Tax=Botrytis byssoidea TaxID=139641 RepID=A0A9P5M2A5_9HELO|nr:uncharacterized protein EAE97_006507 [Botrytis byssoidea]KAF7941670.1 hypothetical protein EAE97_006507 [Botrytis byssoidea]
MSAVSPEEVLRWSKWDKETLKRKAEATLSDDKQDFKDKKTAEDILAGQKDWSPELILKKKGASRFDTEHGVDKYIATAISMRLQKAASAKANEDAKDAQKAMAKLSMNSSSNDREIANQGALPREGRNSVARQTGKHDRDHSIPRAGEPSKKPATDSTKTGSSKPSSHSTASPSNAPRPPVASSSTATGSTHDKHPESRSSRPTNPTTASSSKPPNPPTTTSTHGRRPEPRSSRPNNPPATSAPTPKPPKPTTVVASSSNSSSGPFSKIDLKEPYKKVGEDFVCIKNPRLSGDF